MKKLGRHLIAEFADCDGQKLADVDFIEDCLNEAVRKSGATIINSVFHRYNPQGVSGVVVIAESHMSIHTWPEYNYAAVDFFTCGESVDPHKAYRYMKRMLRSKTSQLSELDRGIPSEADEILNHKPASLKLNKHIPVR